MRTTGRAAIVIFTMVSAALGVTTITTTHASGAGRPAPKLEVESVGFQSAPVEVFEGERFATSFAGVVTNPGDDVASAINVAIELRDEDGRVIPDTAGFYDRFVVALFPGESVVVAGANIETDVLVGEVRLRPRASRGEDPATFSFAADADVEGVAPSDALVLSDLRYRGTGDGVAGLVYGQLQNTTSLAFGSVGVSCALRSGGEIVGGAEGTTYAVPVSSSIGAQAHGPDALIVDEVQCSALPSIGAAHVDEVTVDAAGFGGESGENPEVSGAARVTNPGSKVAEGVTASFDYYDAAGVFVGSTSAQVSYVRPSETVSIAGSTYPTSFLAGPPTSVRVRTNVNAFVTERAFKREHGFPANDRFEIDDPRYTDDEVVGEVRNEGSSTAENVNIECALMRGGAIVGGASGTDMDPIRAGDSRPFELLTVAGLDPDEIQCNAHRDIVPAG